MKILLLVAFTCVVYIVNAATVYNTEVVREKRSPIFGAAALGLGGAAILGAGALGAGIVGAGALGAGALGLGVAKGVAVGAIGRSYGGYGYGHGYGYGPHVHVYHHVHDYDDYGYHGGYDDYDW